MAQHNEILEGQLQQLLTRRLGMQGGSPAPVLAPEIMPVLVVQDEAPELQYLKGVRLFARGSEQALDAGATVAMRIANPAGSNVIAVIEGFDIGISVAGQVTVEMGYTTTNLTNTGAMGWRDARGPVDVLAGTLASPIRFSRGALAAAVGVEVARLRLPAGESRVVDRAFVLTPGSAIDVRTGSVNTALSCSFWGRFRAAVSGELLG